MEYMKKYIRQFYMDLITYPCLNPDADIPNFC